MVDLAAGQRELWPGVVADHPAVNVEGMAGRLVVLMQKLGPIHLALFARPLVVTSAKDGAHAPGSLHAEGRAFDYRTRDKLADENGIFLDVVTWLSPLYQATIFDERNLPGAQHVHVEYHGA